MSDQQTAEHLRKWLEERSHGHFDWPTDGCGYDQHMRFVRHRNDNWAGGSMEDFRAFVLAYAESLSPSVPQE